MLEKEFSDSEDESHEEIKIDYIEFNPKSQVVCSKVFEKYKNFCYKSSEVALTRREFYASIV
jgi:hypothetical protein